MSRKPVPNFVSEKEEAMWWDAHPQVLAERLKTAKQHGRLRRLSETDLSGASETAMKNPPHVGDLIKTEIIEAYGLSVSKAAAILKVRRATLSDLLNGKAALTPDMALRIEKAFGPDMQHLLRMQLAYDVSQARQHPRVSIKRYVPVSA
jgi:addiction module HigA family antidote